MALEVVGMLWFGGHLGGEVVARMLDCRGLDSHSLGDSLPERLFFYDTIVLPLLGAHA